MGMLLTYRPGYYPDDALDDDAKRAAVAAAGAHGDKGDEFAALSDEQVAELYAEKVGGNASTRRGQLKALRKLEPETPTETPEGDGDQPDPENEGGDPADEPGQPDPENDPEGDPGE